LNWCLELVCCAMRNYQSFRELVVSRKAYRVFFLGTYRVFLVVWE
jgi:hypothetical protein